MATFSFQRVLVWDILPGGTLRTLRNGQVTVKNATTDAVIDTVTSDANGMVTFATTDVPTVYLVSPNGLVSEHITAASVLESAAAAALNNDAGVASFVSDTGSATRAALNATIAAAIDPVAADVADLDAGKAPLDQGVLAQDTAPADTSRIWLDTSSTVFTPSSAFVSMLTAASVPTGYSNGITVPFSFASHDDAGYWDSANFKFVAQSAGRYVLRCQVSWANEDTGERWVEIWSDRNAAPRVYASSTGHPVAGAVVDNFQAQFGPFQFDAGTSFWVVARHTATTNPLALSTANALTWFSIERVG